MTLLIDTAAVPALERVDFWLEESCDAYHPLQIRTDAKERFSGRMWGDQLGSIGVFRIATAANTMSRTRKTIEAGDPECLHFQMVVRGRLQEAQEDRTAVLAPGDMASYDTSRPAIFRADEAFECVVLKIPREALGAHAAKLSCLTAVRIPGASGLPHLAARFFLGVADGLADGRIARTDVNVADRVIDLVRAVYADCAVAPRARSKTELLLHAQAVVEANLSDPNLGPEQVARACFISTRYLYRVFERDGLSVCEWIRSARLDRCRRDLLDPALADQSIVTIASRWGLPNAQHFSRLFRGAYGCSPSELRRTAGALEPAGTLPS
jgi:AraC-like DNA-binding protein